MQQVEQLARLSLIFEITKKDMTDAGMCIADANAIMAEVKPLQGDLL